MKITTPELKVVRFENDDVIATSIFIVADSSSGTGFSFFNGSMDPLGEDGTWIVAKETDLQPIDDFAELESYKSSMWASEIYDAYQTEPYGPYYTKGTSYYELYGNQ